MVDPVMGCLPLFGGDHVVLLDGVLNNIGSGKHLLSVLLGVCLDPTDLGSMGSPLYLSIIHLQEIKVSRLSRSLLPLLLPGIQASLSWVGNEARWRFHAGLPESPGADDHWELSNQGPPSREGTIGTDY